ncbi:MAG: hypothetical protein ACE37K_15905 [Planctomycetota bacterium]
MHMLFVRFPLPGYGASVEVVDALVESVGHDVDDALFDLGADICGIETGPDEVVLEIEMPPNDEVHSRVLDCLQQVCKRKCADRGVVAELGRPDGTREVLWQQ